MNRDKQNRTVIMKYKDPKSGEFHTFKINEFDVYTVTSRKDLKELFTSLSELPKYAHLNHPAYSEGLLVTMLEENKEQQFDKDLIIQVSKEYISD